MFWNVGILLQYWLKDRYYWGAMNLLLNNWSSQRWIWLALRTLSSCTSEQESPLQYQPFPIRLRLICWSPWMLFTSITSVKSNRHLTEKSIETYIHQFMQHLIHTKTVVKFNEAQNTQVSNNVPMHTHNFIHDQTQIHWIKSTLANLQIHRFTQNNTHPHKTSDTNTDTQQYTYLMLRKDRWVVVLIQNFNNHSAGAI